MFNHQQRTMTNISWTRLIHSAFSHLVYHINIIVPGLNAGLPISGTHECDLIWKKEVFGDELRTSRWDHLGFSSDKEGETQNEEEETQRCHEDGDEDSSHAATNQEMLPEEARKRGLLTWFQTLGWRSKFPMREEISIAVSYRVVTSWCSSPRKLIHSYFKVERAKVQRGEVTCQGHTASISLFLTPECVLWA